MERPWERPWKISDHPMIRMYSCYRLPMFSGFTFPKVLSNVVTTDIPNLNEKPRQIEVWNFDPASLSLDCLVLPPVESLRKPKTRKMM